jgi:hypothetical protein
VEAATLLRVGTGGGRRGGWEGASAPCSVRVRAQKKPCERAAQPTAPRGSMRSAVGPSLPRDNRIMPLLASSWGAPSAARSARVGIQLKGHLIPTASARGAHARAGPPPARRAIAPQLGAPQTAPRSSLARPRQPSRGTRLAEAALHAVQHGAAGAEVRVADAVSTMISGCSLQAHAAAGDLAAARVARCAAGALLHARAARRHRRRRRQRRRRARSMLSLLPALAVAAAAARGALRRLRRATITCGRHRVRRGAGGASAQPALAGLGKPPALRTERPRRARRRASRPRKLGTAGAASRPFRVQPAWPARTQARPDARRRRVAC